MRELGSTIQGCSNGRQLYSFGVMEVMEVMVRPHAVGTMVWLMNKV